jgi:hypothetical protein
LAATPESLLVRGTATLRRVDGVPAEYLAASSKQVGAEGMPAFEAQARAVRPDGAHRHRAALGEADRLRDDAPGLADALRDAGAAGWELVTIVPTVRGVYPALRCVFKRPAA